LLFGTRFWTAHGDGGVFVADEQGEGEGGQGEYGCGDEGGMVGCQIGLDGSCGCALCGADCADDGAQDGDANGLADLPLGVVEG
jgi:hypothetical protein